MPGYFGTSVTPGDVDGWLLSNGNYDDAAGTVTNGVWGLNGSSWVLTSGGGYYAPAFTVRGRAVLSPAIMGGASSAIPESSIWSMMLVGFAGLGLAAYRTRKADHTARFV